MSDANRKGIPRNRTWILSHSIGLPRHDAVDPDEPNPRPKPPANRPPKRLKRHDVAEVVGPKRPPRRNLSTNRILQPAAVRNTNRPAAVSNSIPMEATRLNSDRIKVVKARPLVLVISRAAVVVKMVFTMTDKTDADVVDVDADAPTVPKVAAVVVDTTSKDSDRRADTTSHNRVVRAAIIAGHKTIAGRNMVAVKRPTAWRRTFGIRIDRGPETLTPVQGILELHPKGYGFLRDPKAGYISQESDSFVSGSLLEKYGIREGVLITGESIPGGRGQGPRLKSIQSIEGRLPELYAEVKNFDSLTPINPNVQIKLETGAAPVTMRVMDLLTPIGKGQRALIVAPPRSGKTMLLQEIADSVSTNYPDIYLIVLLIDERPEEVTEMRRRVKGEVVASSLDREVENHIRVSQLVFERAKRMAESGRDVFLLLDSITRTARAFNKWTNTGRTGTGGLDVKAMDIPKKMFGMARQFDEGGSMTVVGTALIETGSRMDEAIFLEFKGTGNMEMVLSRELSERRIWPAIDISKSGTRREEKILPPDVLEGVTLLRRSLVSLSPVEAMEQLTRILHKYPTNADFLAKVRSIL